MPNPAPTPPDAKSGPERAAMVGAWPRCEDDLAAAPRLRRRRHEDGAVVGVSRQRRRARDFVCFWGPGRLGIYYERPTVRGARLAARGYGRDRRVVQEIPGDLDGIVVYEPTGPEDIPRCFFKDPARNPGRSAEHMQAIRPRRQP